MSRREQFTNRIWTQRHQKGMSQKDLAQAVGHKDQTTICHWERGDKIPSLASGAELAIVLDTQIECLFRDYFLATLIELRTKEEKMPPITVYNEQQLSDEEIMSRGENYPNNIWLFRQKRGMSQKYLADRLGIKDQSQICHWEKGSKIPSVKNAIRLAIALHTSIECLFFDYFKNIRLKHERQQTSNR